MSGEPEPGTSPRERALSRLAVVLTETPWRIDVAEMNRLRGVGLDDAALEQAISVAALFNYFTRVADGTGIQFDYESPLSRIDVDRSRQAAPRPASSAGDSRVDGSRIPALKHRPAAVAALTTWRAYLFEPDPALSTRDRRVVARAAAEACADAGALRTWADDVARGARETALASYATALSLTPWAVGANDLVPLRAHGLDDCALLHVIALTAQQNAFSRFAHALAALER